MDKDFVMYGRKHGWLEEIDQINLEKQIDKLTAARILHQFLKLEIGESDEANWNEAANLKDLYDCHTCVNHIAQMYVKGIMPTKKVVLNQQQVEIFGMKDYLTKEEALTYIKRVFYPKLRFKNMSVDKSKHLLTLVTQKELSQIREQYPKAFLIDVRSVSEYEEEHLKCALHIPMAKFLDAKDPVAMCMEQILTGYKCLEEFKDPVLILYCDQGYQSQIAGNCLLEHGCSWKLYSLKMK